MSEFHNREPRTREERSMLHNRDAIEASLKTPLDPFTIMPNSSLYAGAEERFNREVAASIRHEKEIKEQKKMVCDR
jgi:hypothetical protein